MAIDSGAIKVLRWLGSAEEVVAVYRDYVQANPMSEVAEKLAKRDLLGDYEERMGAHVMRRKDSERSPLKHALEVGRRYTRKVATLEIASILVEVGPSILSIESATGELPLETALNQVYLAAQGSPGSMRPGAPIAAVSNRGDRETVVVRSEAYFVLAKKLELEAKAFESLFARQAFAHLSKDRQAAVLDLARVIDAEARAARQIEDADQDVFCDRADARATLAVIERATFKADKR